VSRPEHTELLARTLGLLGTERAWVVHGAGGLDELSTLGHTKVSEVHQGLVNTFYVHPADVGLASASREDLAGGTAEENAALAERVLANEPGPRRDIVLLNAGAAIFVAGRAASLEEGVALAATSLASGRARGVLESLRRICGR
jgi:anthranilate phosphoribosyltransferase